MSRNRLVVALTAALLLSRAYAYGPEGHHFVGAIADLRLASKPVATKIADLLDGLTLAEAALLPDKIKEWDKKGPDDPNTFHLPDHLVIETDLRAFFMANPPTNQKPDEPNHHWFHYTDVPVTGTGTYASGTTGRSKYDVVHMIPFCVKVLKGDVPEDNDRKITKRMAVILLAHFVGDIHQPLHVGAVYFNEAGKPVDPDAGDAAVGDEGGNALTLVLQRPDDHGHRNSTYKLHGYWDNQSVTTAFDILRAEVRRDRGASSRASGEGDLAGRLAVAEPAAWKLPDGVAVEDWATKWADEILPLAREAHSRLEFRHIHVDMTHKRVSGQAVEPAKGDGPSYHDFAGKAVRDELHKAGWRLAALLENALQ